MSKRMIIMLILTGLLFGGIFAYKAFESFMTKKYMSSHSTPPVAVSAMTVTLSSWQPHLTATASLRAIKGVDITSEVQGLIKTIWFKPGQIVNQGDLILELNPDVESAQLRALEAQAELAQITYKRDKEQFIVHGVSQATLDMDEANLKSAIAQVDRQKALIAQKIIRAPFKGRLGISAVNLGQFLNPGDKIVTLQSLDPIYADFYLPQQDLAKIALNQTIFLTTDSYSQASFAGKITTINPIVDLHTRNVEVEGTLSNAEQKLLPGMYGVVTINTGAAQDYLTLPQTVISYNPYGDLVYVLKEKEKDKSGNIIYVATQKFVTVGETRGDQIQILSGIEKGELVVTAGQLKLKNGSLVIINNSIVPSNSPTPQVINDQD